MRVVELGNGVYRVEDVAPVNVNECQGVRLPGGASDFITDLLRCARDLGVAVGERWIDAMARADVESTLVFIVFA